MKSYIIILILSSLTIFNIKAKDIELEPQIGVSLSSYGDWGFNCGGMASLSLSSLFYIQSGLLLNMVQTHLERNLIEVNVPVYASFRIPIKNIKIRLNAGPYMEFNDNMNIGLSAGGGVEYKKIYMGLSYSQNCTQQSDILFNLSIGYKFVVK